MFQKYMLQIFSSFIQSAAKLFKCFLENSKMALQFIRFSSYVEQCRMIYVGVFRKHKSEKNIWKRFLHSLNICFDFEFVKNLCLFESVS